MKKLLSVILAVSVILMSGITAFAAEKTTSEKVKEQIDGAAAYLTSGVTGYGVDEAIDLCILANSGADVSAYKDGFLNAVKANLDANSGKIVSSYGENLATYGAVIITLISFDEDTTDFYGYNIENAFLAMDPTVAPASPNYYRIIAQGAFYCDNSDDFLVDVCDAYVSGYYTMGMGADYYGYSCDNTGYFIDAISYGYFVDDKYKAVLDDAIAVLDTYKVDGGYCYNPAYGTQPNADSTALALLAHCAYTDDIETKADFDAYFTLLNGIYADLCTFEGSATGVFTYDGADSAYTTKEALMALSEYYIVAYIQENSDEEEVTDITNEPEITVPTTKEPETTTKTEVIKKSPATGAGVSAISSVMALFAAAGVITVLKKKEK